MKIMKSEKGQALYLVVIGIISLIGFTALTIDGGRLYSERRAIQGVSDTAAFTGAVFLARAKKVTDTVKTTSILAANEIAKDNGYDDADADVTVTTTITRDGHYYIITTNITSAIDPTFAHVIYDGPLSVTAQAVTRVLPLIEAVFGNALVSLSETACPDALKFGGTADTEIYGTGIFSNSDCDDAIAFQGGAGMHVDGDVAAVGGIYGEENASIGGNVIEGAPKLPAFDIPVPYCPDETPPVVPDHETPGVAKWSPGIMYGGSDGWLIDDTSNHHVLESGLYCIYGVGGFRIENATVSGDGVIFYVRDGPVKFNAQALIDLKAPTPAKPVYDGHGEAWRGMLFYVTSGAGVTINGDAGSYFEGTIYAPDSVCKINGNSTTDGYDLSVVCDTVTLTGTESLKIVFDHANHYLPPTEIDLLQ